MTNGYVPIIEKKYNDSIIKNNIGFSKIPDIVRSKSIELGFNINILVVGRRGLGTKTLLNSLFECPIVESSRSDEIVTTTNEIYENDICLRLNATTYHKNDIKEIKDYIEECYMKFFVSEQSHARRKDIYDTRIHICLYMIPGDNLTTSELNLLSEISKLVNIVPIISKADSYTKKELNDKKRDLNILLAEQRINVFRQETNHDTDIEYVNEVKNIINSYPLAVFSCTDELELRGRTRKGRLYPWVFLDIEDERINDFKKLRRLIIHKHFDDLIQITDTYFYNNFRNKIYDRELKDSKFKKNRFERVKFEMEKIYIEKHAIRMRQLEDDFLNLEIETHNAFRTNKRKNIQYTE